MPYRRDYRPIFHHDNTVTYWHDSYGWFHRAHPLNVPASVRGRWERKDRERWLGAMKLLGYECIAGTWIKTVK